MSVSGVENRKEKGVYMTCVKKTAKERRGNVWGSIQGAVTCMCGRENNVSTDVQGGQVERVNIRRKEKRNS